MTHKVFGGTLNPTLLYYSMYWYDVFNFQFNAELIRLHCTDSEIYDM